MKIVRGLGKAFKPLVNFPAWMGWKQLSQTGKDISSNAKELLTPQKATRQETFDAAVRRLGLSEQDIQQRMKAFKKMALLYSVIALGLAGYCIYLVIFAHVAAAFLTLILVTLALTLAFREHFWYFQMKNRRLGCTIKDWLNSLWRGAK